MKKTAIRLGFALALIASGSAGLAHATVSAGATVQSTKQTCC